jgi:hypothetical protein
MGSVRRGLKLSAPKFEPDRAPRSQDQGSKGFGELFGSLLFAAQVAADGADGETGGGVRKDTIHTTDGHRTTKDVVAVGATRSLRRLRLPRDTTAGRCIVRNTPQNEACVAGRRLRRSVARRRRRRPW